MAKANVVKTVAYQVSKVNDYYPEDLGPDACSIYATAAQEPCKLTLEMWNECA